MSDETEEIAISMTASQWDHLHDFVDYVEWSGISPPECVQKLAKTAILLSCKARGQTVRDNTMVYAQKHAVFIQKQDGGLLIEVYAKGREDEPCVASLWAHDNDVREVKKVSDE